MLGLQLQPAGSPGAHGVGDRLQLPPLLGEPVVAAAAGRIRFSGRDAVVGQQLQPLGQQRLADPGGSRQRSPKVQQPVSRLRMMIGVHRSASSSEVRAIGQYCP